MLYFAETPSKGVETIIGLTGILLLRLNLPISMIKFKNLNHQGDT